MQQQQFPKIIWVILGLLLLLSCLSVGIAIHNPSGRSYPRMISVKGDKGDPGEVDYGKLALIIHNEVAALPTPKSGTNGKDGQSIVGPQGAMGPPGQTIIGPPGVQGEQGDPGADGKSIELRYNTAKSQIEYRYSGDVTWNLLVSACTLTNTCGP